MVSIDALLGFSLIALGVALTPGPNMVYAMSRSLDQGRTAGMIALLGILAGSLAYLVPAALGVGVLLRSVPRVYDVLRVAGAIYLGYLAWKAIHPTGWVNVDSPPLVREGHATVFRSGVLVSLLNPATALLYLTVIPKFVDPAGGSALGQTLELGMAYVVINGSVKTIAVVLAGALARVIASNPAFARAQGWATGIALAVLALNLGLDAGRPLSSTAAPSTQQIEITTAH